MPHIFAFFTLDLQVLLLRRHWQNIQFDFYCIVLTNIG